MNRKSSTPSELIASQTVVYCGQRGLCWTLKGHSEPWRHSFCLLIWTRRWKWATSEEMSFIGSRIFLSMSSQISDPNVCLPATRCSPSFWPGWISYGYSLKSSIKILWVKVLSELRSRARARTKVLRSSTLMRSASSTISGVLELLFRPTVNYKLSSDLLEFSNSVIMFFIVLWAGFGPPLCAKTSLTDYCRDVSTIAGVDFSPFSQRPDNFFYSFYSHCRNFCYFYQMAVREKQILYPLNI